MGVTELGEYDKFIRNIINEMIGGPVLLKDIFYTASKNEGFGLRLLAERYQTCNYNTIANFLQRVQGTRDFIEWQFREERRKRSVKTEKKGT
jgi:hypothetical protein